MARSKSLTDQLKRYRSCVTQAQRWRSNEGYDDLWKRLKDLYRGKHFPKSITTEDRIAVNVAFSTINVISPSVSINHPQIAVAAQKQEDADRATIVEAIVNYWWRHYEFKPEFRRAVKDFLIFGHGWVKTGYRFVEEQVDRSDDAIDGEYQTQKDQADEFAAQNPEQAGNLPTDDEIRAGIADTEMRVVEDRPFVERVSVFDVFVDPEATSLDDARWIAQRIRKDLDEVQNDERYRSSARNKVKPDREVEPTITDRGRTKDEDKRVTVWEYYDLKRGTLAVFSEVGDDFLVDPTHQPYRFGHPFVMLRNYEVPDDLYPMGELEAIEDLQGELNKQRSQQMNFRKRYARKYLYDPRAFNKAAIGQLESERDGAMIPVNEGVSLAEAVVPMKQESVDPQMFQMSEQTLSDVNLITGVNEYQRGELPEIRRTATEASIIQDAANSRAADKLNQIETTLSDIARRVVQLAQQYMTQESVARVVGVNGAQMWVPFEPDFIQGEFDFEVEGGSTTPKNDTARRQSAHQLLTAMAPLIPTGVINLPELLRHVLQEGFGIKDATRFLTQQEPPGPPEPIHQDPMAGGTPQLQDAQPPAQFDGQSGPPSPVAGIPPELAAQLHRQVGLNL